METLLTWLHHSIIGGKLLPPFPILKSIPLTFWHKYCPGNSTHLIIEVTFGLVPARAWDFITLFIEPLHPVSEGVTACPALRSVVVEVGVGLQSLVVSRPWKGLTSLILVLAEGLSLRDDVSHPLLIVYWDVLLPYCFGEVTGRSFHLVAFLLYDVSFQVVAPWCWKTRFLWELKDFHPGFLGLHWYSGISSFVWPIWIVPTWS